MGILSLHGHLKTLEGKYIDLANYYKQELIQSTAQNEEAGKNQVPAGPSQKLRPSSSSTNQRKLQSSAKRAGSRESTQGNTYMRKNHIE